MKRIFFLLALVFFNFLHSQSDFVHLFGSEDDTRVSCYRIPSMVTATNGDIIAVIDQRVPSCADLKWSPDINIVMRRSCDNGKTWGPIKTLVDYPLGKSASDPSMILDSKTNTIFLFYNYMDLDNEKDIYYLKYISSIDHGKTWSAPVDITEQISKSGWKKDFKFITSGRGIQTKDGKLLHCLVNLQRGTHVFGSKNHGKTWFVTDTPVKPADESVIVELDDGKWMINSRVNKRGVRYSHISSDQGKTWETKKEMDLKDPGCNASFIKYDYGKYKESSVLLLSHINNSSQRKGIVLRYSLDNGKSWSSPKKIYEGGAGYSSMTVLKNGDIGLFFEMDNYRKNVFTRIPFEWILN